MKARTSTKRNKGRPRHDGYDRTPSGRKSRSSDADTVARNLAMEVAAWTRLRNNPGLTPVEVAGPEFGSVVHMWFQASQRFKEINKDKWPMPPNPREFTTAQFNTAEWLHKTYLAYKSAIAAKSPRSSTDFGGAGGHDNLDPFEAERAKRDQIAVEIYAGTISGRDGVRRGGVRQAILDSGSFGMMAVEAILFENKDCPELLADFRLALNSVERLWRLAKAA